jgi:capsular exopolysaccharide synthesis family protein
LPTLAAIPAIRGGKGMSGISSGRSPLMLGDKLPGNKLAHAAGEAYRQLRTAVLLSNPGRAPKTILVTSSVPSEGKTTSAVNLAISLAQTKASVLLIDADLRRPRLHTIFGLNNRRGLSTCLSSEMPAAEAGILIQHHEETNISILTSGPVPPNPAELLGSEQMRQLLAGLEPEFTYIVIDSAPSASFTDAVLLSAMVDGLLLVVHSNSTPRDLVLRTKHLLTGAGAKIFGVVLSQVAMSSQDAIYGNYHYKPNEKEIEPLPRHLTKEVGDTDKTAKLTTAAAEKEPEGNSETPSTPETDATEPAPSAIALNGKHAPAALLTHVNGAKAAANGSSNGVNGDHAAPFAREQLNGKNGNNTLFSGLSTSGLMREIVNNLMSADPQRSRESNSMLLLILDACGGEPLLQLIEEHPDELTRVALIKLLSASEDESILPGLVHLAIRKSMSPKELSAVMDTINWLASQKGAIPVQSQAVESEKSSV